jgi:2-dehydro-3-deoxygluconokinase
MVLVVAELGRLETASSAALRTGGAEGNVAIGLARLGIQVQWLGRVGDDAAGRRVVRDLRAEGVTVSEVVDPAMPTGLMVKERPSAGETSVVYYRAGSAGSLLCEADVDRLDIPSADLLHVSGVSTALSESSLRAIDRAVDIAQRAGVRVSFDVNHRARLWGGRDPAPIYRSLVQGANIVFAGDNEAAILAPHAADSAERAERLAALGPSEVVIKRGVGGCLAWIEGTVTAVPAVSVNVVDTVGAGDAFVAGYLAEWLEGATIERRLYTAVMCGALACTVEGDWEGAPRRDDLDRFGGSEPVAR